MTADELVAAHLEGDHDMGGPDDCPLCAEIRWLAAEE
jgi:hypothetical protein